MDVRKLIETPAVSTALRLLEERDDATVDEQIRIALIPAPTGSEGERGAYVRRRFSEIGLEGTHEDEVGNVLGWLGRPANQDSVPPGAVVVAAHLDTIFPPETQVRLRREGRRIFAPSITDNSRGLAATLALAAALKDAGVAVRAPILFAATVGEEGLGDLRGVKHLFRESSPYRQASALLGIDGAGLNRIVHRAIGACRLRVTITGIGGHSWGDRGIPNPVHALGVAIAKVRSIDLEDGADFGVNVGRIGGGTSVNSIPGEAWMELDLRSEDAKTLGRLETIAREIVAAAVQTESAEANLSQPIVHKIEKIGDRPSGATPLDSAVVQAVLAATRHFRVEPELTSSSTDANVPISLGIPAATIGAGGVGGGVHTPGEWYDNETGVLGIQRAMLALLGIAGLAQPD